MNILKSLAENKTITNIMLKQVKGYIKKNDISFLALFLDNNGDIAIKEYNKPMAIILKEDYDKLLKNQKEEPVEFIHKDIETKIVEDNINNK